MTDQPGLAANDSEYATHLVGKTFKIITADQIQNGDVLIDLQVLNLGHQKPTKVDKIRKVGHFVFIDWASGKIQNFAETCIFGRVT